LKTWALSPFGTGIGGIGAYGAMICLIHHSLIKSSLFLTSGNILLGYGSRLIEKTGNLVNRMPKTFVAFFGGFAAISGFPPFGIFIGELFIIVGAFKAGHYTAWYFYFQSVRHLCRFANQAMKISFDEQRQREDHPIDRKKPVWSGPSMRLLLTSLVLCFWMPDRLYQTIIHAVNAVGGGF
jgi:hydrogenase-4 component F